MQKKKIAARICAFSLAASLFAADTLPAFGAAVPGEPAGETQEVEEETAEEQVTSEENAEEGNNAESEKNMPEEELTKPGAEEELEKPGETETEISDEIEEKPEISDGTEEEPEVSDETEPGQVFFSIPEPREVQETEPGTQENKDGLIYVDGVLYSGYYMDNTGILYLVSNGTAEPVSGMVSEGTEYYSSVDQKVTNLSGQTVFVEGKAYTGYYLENDSLYLASNGTAEPVSGTVSEGTEYYSSSDKKVMKLSRKTVYVEGKVYTGYYQENDILYTVSNGTAEVKTGTVGKGTKYYSCKDHGIMALPEQTVFVNGKVYTGYYLDSRDKMYKVKKGIRTLQTGMVKAKTQYYSYKEGKTRKISKKTLYVKGKIYTGYYMNSEKKLYKAKKGICTLQTGTVKAGTKYYNYNTGKKKKLSKDTVYVKGKAYTGFYLDSKKRMYHVKKGTRALQTGILNNGTKYYNYQKKKTKKLSKDTLYVQGKIYTGYYLDNGNIMYSVNNGTCTPVNAALNAGTGYYSFHEGKMTALSKTTVYINGKAMEGMSPESLATLQRAQAVVAGVTNDSMTREEKLRVCFDYVKEAYSEIKPRIPHYLGMDWPVIYANDMFVNGAGNCCSYAAAFAYMAKAIGYEEVYCCNSGGHGWAEIDGLVYDPEWSKWHHVYNYYALSYDTPTDQDYKGAIGARKPWMRIKI